MRRCARRVLAAGVPLGQGALFGSARGGARWRLCRSGPRCRLRFARAAARQTPCRPRPLRIPAIPLINSIAPLADATARGWSTSGASSITACARSWTHATPARAIARAAASSCSFPIRPARTTASPRSSMASACRATSWDAIVTSGDVARTLIAAYAGRAIFHIGPERDLAMFAGLDVVRVDARRRRGDRLHGAVRRRARDTGRLCGDARSSASRAGCR